MPQKVSDDSAMGALGGVVVIKQHKRTNASEFMSHWVPHSNGLVLHLSKKLSKLHDDRTM